MESIDIFVDTTAGKWGGTIDGLVESIPSGEEIMGDTHRAIRRELGMKNKGVKLHYQVEKFDGTASTRLDVLRNLLNRAALTFYIMIDPVDRRIIDDAIRSDPTLGMPLFVGYKIGRVVLQSNAYESAYYKLIELYSAQRAA